MAGVKINFAEVESSFEALPEGRYECVIEKVEVRDSKSSDNDYLNWELNVMDDEYEGRKLWMITSLSEKALFRLKDVFLALGVIEEDDEVELEWEDDVDIQQSEGPLVTNPELEGLACIAVVGNEMYEGREKNRVNDLLDGSGEVPEKAKTSTKKVDKKAPAKARKAGTRQRTLR